MKEQEKAQNQTSQKPCTLCIFVRYFAIFAFLLTVAFYLYHLSQKSAVAEKADRVMQATMEADL